MHVAHVQVLCTPAAAGSGSKPAAKSQNGDSTAAAAAKASQTYLIATKELRIEAASTAAAQCFLSNCFPEQGGVVGMPVGMQITACDAQVSLRSPILCYVALVHDHVPLALVIYGDTGSWAERDLGFGVHA